MRTAVKPPVCQSTVTCIETVATMLCWYPVDTHRTNVWWMWLTWVKAVTTRVVHVDVSGLLVCSPALVAMPGCPVGEGACESGCPKQLPIYTYK